MRRLYLQIYLAFVGILIFFGVLASIAWFLIPSSSQEQQRLEGMGAALGELLPGPERPTHELQAALERIAVWFPAHLSVRAPDQSLLAAVGEPTLLPAGHRRSGWLHVRGSGWKAAFRLPDGRWVVARSLTGRRHWFPVLGLLAVAVAIGAYPIVRRITRRLERLQLHVDELGAGDLRARVDVEGNDEIAGLAKSFNHAADRIEQLVAAQRSMFAGASHELRSPLARMRVAIELLGGDERADVRARLEKDIADMDDLIEELLLASRLDARVGLESCEEVDLLGLLAEEGTRVNALVSGEPVCIQGNARMLRRLIRNLLENARRYGGGSAVDASVVALEEGGGLLRVTDTGAGVPEEERERIFEPFYRLAGVDEPPNGGVGLGLHLVRQIARRHGGDARCTAPAARGTCFEITLRDWIEESAGRIITS